MRLHFIENGPALLVEQEQRVLVVADLHMGIESGLERCGVHITSRSDARAKRVIACIEETRPDLLLLLGDLKHNVPVTTRQEYRELPRILQSFRELVPIAVTPGNHDGGIDRFLQEGELLPAGGALIDGVGYLHGHTHPAPSLLGRLIILGHHHPVVSLMDSVGCAARAQPAYLYSVFEEPTGERSRLLFVPAFNELAGGIDVGLLRESGLGPLSRCIDDKNAEVFLADGTYVGSPATLCPQTPTAELLDPRVREVVRKRGFTEFSEAQEQSIPRLLAGDNLILVAPTGTGKTESAMLPVFDRLLETPGPGFKALYITPLRSLNRDILARMEWWCRELSLTVGVRHGDTPQNERRKQALNAPDLLITTPESLQALFMGKRLREHLKNVRYVIIDEIHDLAESKRGAQLAVALERLAEYAGEFQRIGLSATVGNPDEIGRFLCGARPFSVVEVPVASNLDITVRFAGEDFGDQVRTVERCLDAPGSTLVFVNTRVTAEALGHSLYSRGDVEVHHGSLSRDVRVDAEERFRNGEIRALIATSSMELGIDIGHIEHVLQFGSPREVSRLVQRVGRAGHRLDAVSRGTVLATGFDDLLESLVIARRAKANECERVVPPAGAADVLANQVAAIAVEYGEIEISRLRKIVERSSIFAGCGSLLDDVCRQMAEHRLIRVEGTRVIRTGRARRYLVGNLSMIHDERKMEVFDIVSRRTVGTLDESFVLGWMQTGAVFITKGQLWRVLDMEGGRITVEPAARVRGEVPSWEGEQIPVPFAVAREVGALRRMRAFGRYSDVPGVIGYAERFMARMDGGNHPVPSDRLITLENADEGVVCNVCGGHKANETLARALSILISARYGTTVGIEVGAYRFLLRLPGNVRALEVQEAMAGIEPEHLAGILRLALKRTALFKWKLVQVAKKFGAIDADADYERFSIHRLIDLFDGTVIAAEAYRELFSRYMDVEAAEEILAGIRDGRIAVTIGRLSPIGSEGLSSSRDTVPPPMIDQAVIGTLMRRLEKEEVVLFCMNCRKWKSRTVVERVPDRPQCPLCGARLIAALKPWDEELIPAVTKKKKSEEERAIEVRFLRNANIVLSSGKKAVTALAAKGVGPETASRILATLSEGDAFYREILKAERNYVKTHRFW